MKRLDCDGLISFGNYFRSTFLRSSHARVPTNLEWDATTQTCPSTGGGGGKQFNIFNIFRWANRVTCTAAGHMEEASGYTWVLRYWEALRIFSSREMYTPLYSMTNKAPFSSLRLKNDPGFVAGIHPPPPFRPIFLWVDG